GAPRLLDLLGGDVALRDRVLDEHLVEVDQHRATVLRATRVRNDTGSKTLTSITSRARRPRRAPAARGQVLMSRRADTVGGAGYGCLATLALAGGLGGTAAVLVGIARFVRARDARLESGADAAVFLGGLEGAVVLVAV